MDMNLTLQQHQSLSQSQIQSLSILSFDSVELNEFLRDEYLENPLLDYTETVPGITRSETISSYTNISSSFPNTSRETMDIPSLEDTSIKQYLLQQLDISQYTRYEWNLMHYLIDCLDDNGYFHFTPEEIAKQTGTKVSVIRRCLSILRCLEPAGVFSFDLPDCLIRQLDDLSDDFETMKKIISEHLEDISLGKVSSVSRALNLSTADVRKCIARIRSLNPKPLSGFLPGNEQYIIPDIIFTKDKETWSISLNDGWTTNYHLNDYYFKMLKTTSDPELLSYFEEKLAHIQFIFSCIEQRRKTILSIAEEILKNQEDFFNSKGNLRPMTMLSLAETLGMHPSTFSRALKGKYIQYPGGCILCKNLFTTAVTSGSSNGTVSQSDVKTVIQELINSENKSRPYSDQAIVKFLKEQDITISRRAVTKYRMELGIGSSVERRE